MPKPYIPDRNHIIWFDFEPTKGKGIGKYCPTFVLSSKQYNQSTGLVICCPISTSIRSTKTEVPISNLEQPSVIAASLIQTLSWKERKAKFITNADTDVINQVLYRIIPLIGAEKLFNTL
ncbi:type II toxin-antitoxin system PemK/MazF family toxin [Thiotrichales bacterium 19S3-7]|nr:type II toxin-antitoxin system PemK/MazF family toxin [Thiotrichales bacterium 19S3-7]MCF6801409.1 type II toxin-antitoxin system PemK/MazF family toxin [Thiotrichales bacterium 19S3-11]